MIDYEEKQLYSALKAISKSRYLTQHQLSKYENNMFQFLLNSEYIQPKGNIYTPKLKDNGMFEFHDTDRYELSAKGFSEFQWLDYIYKNHLQEKFLKYAPIVISLISLVKSFSV